MKKWISTSFVLTLCLIGLTRSNPASASELPQSVEIRAVSDHSSQDAIDMKSKESGEILHVRKAPLLRLGDLSDASVIVAGDRSLLQITLTKEASSELGTFSSQHLGTRLAIVVDGNLLHAPVIRTAIKGGKVEVGPFSEAQAISLARLIHSQALH